MPSRELPRVFATAGALLLSGAALAGDVVPELQLRETRLVLETRLDYDNGSLEGTATLTVRNVSDRATSDVPLLLGRLIELHRASTVDGQDLAFDQDVVTFSDWPERQVNHVIVRLPESLAPGQEATFVTAYSGVVVPYTETGMLYVRDRIDEKFTILRSEAYPFPVVGQPSGEANRSIPWQDFDYRATVSAPERFTVANGGRLIHKEVADGIASWVYESNGPAPFLLLPIAEYELREAGGIRVYSFPEDATGAAQVLEKAGEALGLLEEWFGALGSAPALAIMEIPDGWGSQASLTGGIIQTASAFREPGRLLELYHELSHLWNAPDSQAPSPRWNEGLATFLQFRLAERLDGWGDMEAAAQRSAERVLVEIREDPSRKDVAFPDYGRRDMTGLSYGTGFVMFYLLDELIGEAALTAALERHFQSHRDSGGSFDDLVEYLRDTSPVDLALFLSDWARSAGWQSRLEEAGSVAELLATYRRLSQGRSGHTAATNR